MVEYIIRALIKVDDVSRAMVSGWENCKHIRQNDVLTTSWSWITWIMTIMLWYECRNRSSTISGIYSKSKARSHKEHILLMKVKYIS